MRNRKARKLFAAAVALVCVTATTAACLFAEEWALRAPVRPMPPPVKQADWGRNPVDAFILARLEEKHLAPSPKADRPTLIRMGSEPR